MSTFLKSELGVAMSGAKWHSGQFTLWQSTQPDIILFTPTQPVLAKNKKGRYQFGDKSVSATSGWNLQDNRGVSHFYIEYGNRLFRRRVCQSFGRMESRNG